MSRDMLQQRGSSSQSPSSGVQDCFLAIRLRPVLIASLSSLNLLLQEFRIASGTAPPLLSTLSRYSQSPSSGVQDCFITPEIFPIRLARASQSPSSGVQDCFKNLQTSTLKGHHLQSLNLLLQEFRIASPFP